MTQKVSTKSKTANQRDNEEIPGVYHVDRRTAIRQMLLAAGSVVVYQACDHPILDIGTYESVLGPNVTQSQLNNAVISYYVELLNAASTSTVNNLINQVAGTDVDTVTICPQCYRTYNYPSAVDTTWQNPDAFPRDVSLFPTWQTIINNLQNGGDPLLDAITAVRAMNKRVVVSLRMNDRHLSYTPLFPTHNNFYRAHPEYLLGCSTSPDDIYGDEARVFNYAIPEVRQFYKDIIEEICRNYDIDGIELDFLRHMKFFYYSQMDTGRGIMSSFVSEAKAIIETVNTDLGTSITLGARVCPTLSDNYNEGLDVAAWSMIDEITVSSAYINYWEAPIDEFRNVLPNAKIYGELNYIKREVSASEANRRFVTVQEHRAGFQSYLQRGCDGVSFFNMQYLPASVRPGLLSDLLGDIRDLSGLQSSEKMYSLYRLIFPYLTSVLPATNSVVFTMFIADDLSLFSSAALRIENVNNITNFDFEIKINGVVLAGFTQPDVDLFPPVVNNSAQPPATSVRFFTIPMQALEFGNNTIEAYNMSANTTNFHSFELALYA